MKFFIDTANLDQIKEAQDLGILDGVTTNPSLMAKEGITIKIPFAIGDIFYLFISIFSIYWIIINIKSPKKLFVEIFACFENAIIKIIYINFS
jgi:hypothetical protein